MATSSGDGSIDGTLDSIARRRILPRDAAVRVRELVPQRLA
jgi:hypothetical protein